MNLTVAWITARGLFGRRRFLLLFPPPLVLIGLTWFAHGTGSDPVGWAQPILGGLGIAVVLPIVALIVGTGVLGSEIDDGTIVHVLTKPLPRREIILAKLAVAVAVTVTAVCVPMFVAGLIADSVRLGAALALACALGTVAYCALFLLLSLVTRRPVLLGLVYVLLWEGLLGNVLSGTRVLSIQQYVIAVADRLGDSPLLLDGRVSVPLALVMTVVFVAASTVFAIDRLRSFSIAGETS